jgi:exonuclease III
VGLDSLAVVVPAAMNLLSWNCRGLGNPRAIRDLRLLVKEKQPTLLFLMETRAKNKKLQAIRRLLGFEGMFSIDPVGLSGGIALFWKNNGEVSIQNYSLRHINATIKFMGSDFEWKLTGFYGHPNRNKRDESWTLLSKLKDFLLHEWLCLGDFNEIADLSEKVGGVTRSHS